MTRLCAIALCPLLATLASGEDAPDSSAPATPDSLSQAQMQEIFRALQSGYVQPSITEPDELNRAAIQGLLARHKHGAVLLTDREDQELKATPRPPVSESLTEKVAYFRPGTFLAEEIPQWDIALKALAQTKQQTLILDLRSPAPLADVRVVGEILGRFLPKDQEFCQLRQSDKREPILTKGKVAWTGRILLLTDSETNNVAETVAAVLKIKCNAMIIGSPTAGRAAQFHDLPLEGERIFRYADSLVEFADGSSLFGRGLKPDLEVPEHLESKHQVFALSPKEGMKKFIFDKERPRMNEAALVEGSNPELAYQVAKSAQQPTIWDEAPLQDLVVQQAVDYLVTSEVLKSSEAGSQKPEASPDKAKEN